MKFRLTPRALSEAERLQTWWRENRPDSPALFDDEMADAIDRICKKPGIGSVYPAKSGPTVRRVLMKTTRNHVYYAVRDNEVVVLSVWGAPKERGPKL
jgi:plasmid stabilization system protein ParE